MMDPVRFAGIALGLGAAVLQALSYVVSAAYVRGSGAPAWTLVPRAFAAMFPAGVLLCAATLPFASAPVPWLAAAWPALGSTAFCLAANFATYMMLRRVDASKTSPLLGLKVPMLAAFYAFVLGRPCTPLQWVAVGLVVVAAFAMAGTGRRLGASGWAWLLAVCACFSLADWFIALVLDAVAPAFPAVAARSLFALGFIYVVTGLAAAAALRFVPPCAPGSFRRWVAPYAAVWFAAMVLLYACFATCGVVLGNIVQNLRGLVSVFFGWLLARSGRVDLEESLPPAVLAGRVLAAAAMFAAIALFAAGGAVK
ncbi:MAG: hypothetical protein IJ678_05465 [Kiritimatiellae bacterium]|nr:hypothetical protein [Kiritimatiellia bacterium]